MFVSIDPSHLRRKIGRTCFVYMFEEDPDVGSRRGVVVGCTLLIRRPKSVFLCQPVRRDEGVTVLEDLRSEAASDPGLLLRRHECIVDQLDNVVVIEPTRPRDAGPRPSAIYIPFSAADIAASSPDHQE